MNRLIPTAVAIVLSAFVCACDLAASSKPDPKDKRPAQMSMITAADELAARSRLQAIVTAEAGYAATSATGQYATLEQLIEQGLALAHSTDWHDEAKKIAAALQALSATA